MNRNEHLDQLMREAHDTLAEAKRIHVADRRLSATCILYSGGNDSTVLTHLMRRHADYAIHINTGIGIDQTRQFVRDTCAAWDLPLIERTPPPGSTYREQVIANGFPGPAQHYRMYQRLKERALRQVRRELVSNGRAERVIFLAGRRHDESTRRAVRNIPAMEREGSVVWVSPLRNWRAVDMNTYRRRFPDCPRNPVADLLHMSGECLCGAFAKPRELDEIGAWFPEVRSHIEAIALEVKRAGHPEQRCRWGWGAYRAERPSKSGSLCSSCALFERIEDVPAEPALGRLTT